MEVISFDPMDWAAAYQRDRWIHQPGGATDEFVDYVREFVADATTNPLHGLGIGGAKDQLLLEFPPGFDVQAQLLTPIALLAGLDPEKITLSERHIKMYSADADPLPRPHKDRFASTISVGISIDIPEQSHLVLFPHDALTVNPLLRAGLIDALPPSEHPQHTLAAAREVVLYDKPGDVTAFHGSAVWHLRRQSASTIIVYLKCNDFGSDPLGEDPRTAGRRAVSERLLADEARFRDAVPALSARFEGVTDEYGRNLDRHWLNVHVWERPPVMISHREFEVLQALDGRRSVEEVAAAVTSADSERDEVVASLRRLCALGALDLTERS